MNSGDTKSGDTVLNREFRNHTQLSHLRTRLLPSEDSGSQILQLDQKIVTAQGAACPLMSAEHLVFLSKITGE